jgi:DNA adenine methylase
MYIEPFLGGGAMYFAIAPRRAILSDNNAELIETYKTLRTSSALIAKELRELPVSEEEYYRIRDSVPRSRVKRAIRFIYLNRTCYGGVHRTNQAGVFNVPYGGGDRSAKSIVAPGGVLETAAQILRETRELEFLSVDFEFSISRAREGDVVYADPCYRGSARTGYDRYGPKSYSFEDQKRLAKCLLCAYEKNALVLLSTQTTEGFEELVNVGIVLTLWRKPGLTQPGKHQSAKEYLLVLDPKHELARWEPLSDFNVKLNGKNRSDPEFPRVPSTRDIMRRVIREAVKCPLNGTGPTSGRYPRKLKWEKALLEILQKHEDGLSYAEISRLLQIPNRSLDDCLRRCEAKGVVRQYNITGTWRVIKDAIKDATIQQYMTASQRAKMNGIDIRTQYRVDRIARTRPELLDEIGKGALSIAAAYRLCCPPKVLNGVSRLRSAWRRATEEERTIFRAEILNGGATDRQALRTSQ